MIWWGYKLLPRGVRAGMQTMVAVGYTWAKDNNDTLEQIIREANK
jgi:hypothetical protein